MPASKRFMNWTSVGFTPTGSSLIAVTGVTSVTADNGGNLVEFSGDGDHYITTVVNDMSDPTFTIASADIAALNQLTPGLRGIFTATFNDAKNRVTTGGGALLYTVANAIVGGNSGGGQHRQFGASTVTIKTESTDGVTSPVSITAV
jgi:hypothetical protein